MTWACVPGMEASPRFAAGDLGRALRKRGRRTWPGGPGRSAKAGSGERGGLSGWLAGPAGSGCSERGADALGPCCVSGRRGHGRGPSTWALGARGGAGRARAGWAKLGWFIYWAAGRERKGAGLGWFWFWVWVRFSIFLSLFYLYFKQSLNSNLNLNSNHTQIIKTMHKHECNTKI